MMKKILLTAYLLIISTTNFAHEISNPPHVEQFEKTGICINCDLSGLFRLVTQNTGAINLNNSNLIRTSLESTGNGNRQYSNFRNIKGIQFSMCYGDFSYSDFSNADLRGAYMVNNTLTSADFTGANLSGVNLGGSNLYQAKISQAQLNSISNLCDAILPDGQQVDC